MSNVSSVSASVTESVAASVSEQTIASLQSQMMRYAQAANGQNKAASADYKALQNAIQSGNVSDAQAALARLRRDSQTGSQPAAPEAGNGNQNTPTVGKPWNALDASA